MRSIQLSEYQITAIQNRKLFRTRSFDGVLTIKGGLNLNLNSKNESFVELSDLLLNRGCFHIE